jgi:NAD(P)-dependent dehydrogenase (short-subunit alcohol dehydrogenase family)
MKNIIITGASRGIGYETALELSRDPLNSIFAIARNKAGLDKLKKQCRKETGYDNVHVFSFDLSRGDFYKTLLPEIQEHMAKIDILIVNAGLLIHKPFEMMDEADFDDIFNTNVKSVFNLVRCLYFNFAENSHILTIGSMGGFQGSVKFPGLSLYSASKGALAILAECLAEEFKSRAIRVNCLALGSAQTEMLAEAFPGYQAPLSAAEMGGFIADFALRGHQWFNGKILPVSLSTP